jgi:hypothetical protein
MAAAIVERSLRGLASGSAFAGLVGRKLWGFHTAFWRFMISLVVKINPKMFMLNSWPGMFRKKMYQRN